MSLHDRCIVVEMRTFYCHAARASYAMKALKDLGSKIDTAKVGKCVCNETNLSQSSGATVLRSYEGWSK